MYVYLNSRLLPAAAALVSVFDRGFAYGDALIETIKIREGRPVFFREHWQRLTEAMARVGIAAELKEEGLKNQALSLAEANKVVEGRLRLQITRGMPAAPAGPDPGSPTAPTLLLAAEPGGYPAELYRTGMCCLTVPWHRGRFASLKSNNLMATIMARQEASAAQADEALFLSGHGRLLEGAFTNLFLVQPGRLLTAAEDQPILPGIVRQKLIAIAAELGLPLGFATIRPAEVIAGETAAFLTSSLLGVCPVRRIDSLELKLELTLVEKLATRLAELELSDIGG